MGADSDEVSFVPVVVSDPVPEDEVAFVFAGVSGASVGSVVTAVTPAVVPIIIPAVVVSDTAFVVASGSASEASVEGMVVSGGLSIEGIDGSVGSSLGASTCVSVDGSIVSEGAAGSTGPAGSDGTSVVVTKGAVVSAAAFALELVRYG